MVSLRNGPSSTQRFSLEGDQPLVKGDVDRLALSLMTLQQTAFTKHETSFGERFSHFRERQDRLRAVAGSSLRQLLEEQLPDDAPELGEFPRRLTIEAVLERQERRAAASTRFGEIRSQSRAKGLTLESEDLVTHVAGTEESGVREIGTDVSEEDIWRGDLTPWSARRPPYAGISQQLSLDNRGGFDSAVVDWYTKADDGSVGVWSRYVNRDPGDDDYHYMRGLDGVLVWYQMPLDGTIELELDIRCGTMAYWIWLSDTFGFSYSESGVQGFLRVDAIPSPTPPIEAQGKYLALLWDFWFHGSPDDSVMQANAFTPGSATTVRIILQKYPPPPANVDNRPKWKAGTWLLLSVGLSSLHECFLDDVSTDQEFWNFMLVDEIRIRTRSEDHEQTL